MWKYSTVAHLRYFFTFNIYFYWYSVIRLEIVKHWFTSSSVWKSSWQQSQCVSGWWSTCSVYCRPVWNHLFMLQVFYHQFAFIALCSEPFPEPPDPFLTCATFGCLHACLFIPSQLTFSTVSSLTFACIRPTDSINHWPAGRWIIHVHTLWLLSVCLRPRDYERTQRFYQLSGFMCSLQLCSAFMVEDKGSPVPLTREAEFRPIRFWLHRGIGTALRQGL